jgi:molybdopterin synthase catalytic subunit
VLVQLTREPLDPAACTRAVQTDASGAVTLFHGIVRNHNDGKAVEHLEYDAYPELAERQLQAVAREILDRFPIDDIAIAHRIGRLEIGETSLLVAVSSAHRAEAFEACHVAVDRVKESVPIWKKEYGTDGAMWLEGTPAMPHPPTVESPG